jgi:hypothetical protein
MVFRKAERKKAKLRLGIVGSAGSGKTYSALLIAKGLGGKIAVVDTENGSADLYAGAKNIPDYDVLTIDQPYTIEKYLEGIETAEKAGYNVLILDSISHAWAGEGGLLDQQGKIADSGRGNSYTAWRTVTPKHNRFVERMLGCGLHLITTMRAKTEYAMTPGSNGKVEVKKIGMAPIQREGMDYEFTVVFDIDQSHNVQASKDRTSLFDGQIFMPSEKTGEQLVAWLESGKEVVVSKPEYVTAPQKKAIEAIITMNNLDREKVKEYLLTRKVVGVKDDGKPTLNKLHKDYGGKILDNPDGWLKAVAGCKEIQQPQQQQEVING